MNLRDYQVAALKTDQLSGATHVEETLTSLVVPMLGLAGEVGQLLTEYKKHLRDGPAHSLFKERVSEELGDLLWYVANVASKFDLDLDDIARCNLAKTAQMWPQRPDEPFRFDHELPEDERLPRELVVELSEEMIDGRPKVLVSVNGEALGSPLSDNAYDPDGYRFHDAFHLAYAAILGWSPNLRAFLKRKRKSIPLIDEVEDGGRARILEEGIAALAFDYAAAHGFLAGVTELDYRLLRTIKSMTANLEVGSCSAADWQRAILAGFSVWRALMRDRGGVVRIDLNARSIEYLGPSAKPHPLPVSA